MGLDRSFNQKPVNCFNGDKRLNSRTFKNNTSLLKSLAVKNIKTILCNRSPYIDSHMTKDGACELDIEDRTVQRRVIAELVWSYQVPFSRKYRIAAESLPIHEAMENFDEEMDAMIKPDEAYEFMLNHK